MVALVFNYCAGACSDRLPFRDSFTKFVEEPKLHQNTPNMHQKWGEKINLEIGKLVDWYVGEFVSWVVTQMVRWVGLLGNLFEI